MKRKLTIILLFFLCTKLNAQQTWIGQNAVWHYDYWTVGEQGFITVSYTNDVVIDGHNCQHLEGVMHRFLPQQDGSTVYMPSAFNNWDTYVSGDTVFYRNGLEFNILYNFGAQQGDQWIIDTDFEAFGCNDTSSLEVDTTFTTTVAGITMTQMDVFGVPGSTFSTNGPILSRIGYVNQQFSENFLFPYIRACDQTTMEYYYTKFKCYEDDDFSYNPSGDDCEYLLTHLGAKEQSAQSGLYLSPNPVVTDLFIKTEHFFQRFEVLSLSGEVLSISSMDIPITELTMNIANLSPGIYYLRCSKTDGTASIACFVKQ